MLADIIIGRSSYGADRDRDDIHAHATFHCAMRLFLRRIVRVFGG